MSSPPDATRLHQKAGVQIAVAVFLLLTLAYALLIAQQILLWVVIVLTVVIVWYVARLVTALERIATHLDVIAASQSNDHQTDDVE